jgi:hypothetical protein
MPRFLRIDSEWNGGDRQAPATVFVNAANGAQFDLGYGLGYVVTPGKGTTGNDAERLDIDRTRLTSNRLDIVWHTTGGQNHIIKLKFVDDGHTDHTEGATGTKNINSVKILTDEQQN